ncbi:MAG: hypothetical protein ACJAWS_002268 [Oleiphilaceae bacterium]|jgi:hypothetical protein
MTLATIAQKQRKQKNKPTKEDKFQTLWRRIEKQKKLNENRQDELKLFTQRIELDIGESERKLVSIELVKLQKLIEFFSRKSLSQWQREELLHLIQTNFSLIEANPFSDTTVTDLLKGEFYRLFEHWYPEEEDDDYHDSLLKTPKDENAASEEDLFGNIGEQSAGIDDDPINANKSSENDKIDNDEFERLFNDFTDDDEFDDQDRAEEEKIKKINKLLKRSSINNMFRRIAKVLHPDKEQDEQKKEEKHQLMTSLIGARDKNDIPTIFAMYAEYVGEIPEDLAKEDLENINILLNYQLKQLKKDYESAPYQDPKTAMFFDIFQAKTEKGILKNIRARKKDINGSIQASKRFLSRITSLTKLKPVLEEVYQQRCEARFGSLDNEEWDFM